MGGGRPSAPSYIPPPQPVQQTVQQPEPVATPDPVLAEKSQGTYAKKNSSQLTASNQAQDINTGSLGLLDEANKRKKQLLGG